MRTLVLWDHGDQADLIALYLDAEETGGFVTIDNDKFIEQAETNGPWDIILTSIGGDNDDAAFELFTRTRRILPDCPVVGACHATDLIRVARYMTNGMRSHVTRDAAGDFMFLLHVTLESTVEAVLANEKNSSLCDCVRKSSRFGNSSSRLFQRTWTAPMGIASRDVMSHRKSEFSAVSRW